jgi:DNA polymerase III epsilon subunit family exonuclease
VSAPGTGLPLLEGLARSVPVAVLDLEMTGLSPEGDRICEVAVVRGRDGVVEREFQTLIRPDVPMSAGALQCHGITDTMLFGAPVFGEVAGDVVTALHDAVVVCHNVDFDMGFLHRELDGTPLVLPPPVTLDTLLIARRLFSFRRNGLAELCRELDIPLSGAHRALADARATFTLYFKLLEALDPHRAMCVRDVSDLVGALAPSSPLRLQQQQVLRDAHRLQRRVEIEYQTTSDPLNGLTVREVDLWVLRLPRVQGFCHLRGGERVFRLDRMRAVRMTDTPYEVPPDVEIRI